MMKAPEPARRTPLEPSAANPSSPADESLATALVGDVRGGWPAREDAVRLDALLPGAPAGRHLTRLAPERLERVKKAYTTRFVSEAVLAAPDRWSLLRGPVRPEPGDVVLARVVAIGQHKALESPTSRRQRLFLGDEVLVAYGHRYAPDQFEAEVPADLGEVHLIAAGGLAGRVTAMHSAMDEPTVLAPVGLLADDAGVVNLAAHAPFRRGAGGVGRPAAVPAPGPVVIAVLGTSMNSGKSTALACLGRGLTTAGFTVHAGKATGTGAGGDPGLFGDAGVRRVLDFTHFGVGSTFRLDHDAVLGIFEDLVETLSAPVPGGRAPDFVLVEIADGVYQEETARLLRDPVLHDRVDAVVFSAGDALGAVAGVQVLHGLGLDVAAVRGVVTASPLAAREAAAAVGVRVVETYDLADPGWALAVVGSLRATSAPGARVPA